MLLPYYYHHHPGQQGAHMWHMAQAQISYFAEHKYETASYLHPGQSDHTGQQLRVY